MNYHEFCRSIKDKTRGYINFSFSQEGEDMIVDNLLNFRDKGFYVDMGALHPARFSNTMRFYYRGWHGLNIDATPGSMQLFNKLRPRDINVEAGLSLKGGGVELTYYEFDEPALNTFDTETAQRLMKDERFNLVKKIKISTYTAMEILDKYVAENQKIDIMDIDIEGFDEEIVNSVDWGKYHPDIILTEKPHDKEIVPYDVLATAGYEIVAWTGRTVIYKG